MVCVTAGGKIAAAKALLFVIHYIMYYIRNKNDVTCWKLK